ncbi:MAG: sodium/solute symporter [Pirellulales bacterium]
MALFGFHLVDGLVIVIYLAILVWIGAYFSKRQKSLEDFIKGGKQVGWLPIGVSLMAALNSGIDFVQTPAVVYAVGLVFITLILGWLPLYPYISRVTIPFYQKLDVYSAYEYLERRFNVAVRTIASLIFVLWRVGWMGAALYVPILAFQGATGIEDKEVSTTIAIGLGVVVTTYTMLGGIKAVIWTDVLQFCIMFAGLFTMLAVIVWQMPGGIPEIYEIVRDAPRLNLTAHIPEMASATGWEKVRLYFTTEVTVVGIILAVLINHFTAYTCDQVVIQRFQATKSLKDARRAIVINALSDSLWIAVLGLVGLALFAFYSISPMPEGSQNSLVVPHFLREYFPIGLTGLVLAAITAASLSSVDAAINSTTSVVMVDIYSRLFLGQVRPAENLTPNEQKKQVLVSRLTNAVLGIIMISIACYIPYMEKGELYQAVNKILSAFFGPLLGIFLLGMFSKRASGPGVIVGAVTGIATSLFFSFFSEAPWLQDVCGRVFGTQFVEFFREVSWTWPSSFGIVAVVVVGYLASLAIPSERTDQPPLTYRRVMAMAPRDTQ